MQTAIVIPIRGFHSSMSRLRDDFEDDKVNGIVRQLFGQTVDAIRDFELETIIVTADKSISTEYPDLTYIYDDGKDINLAIETVIASCEYDRYILIMPDLPGISKQAVRKIIRLADLHPYVIANTEDSGTACAVLSPEFFKQELLGPNSSQKIIDYAKENKISLSKIEIKDLLVDVDTKEDISYWKSVDYIFQSLS